MAGLGAAALVPIWPASGSAQGRPSLALQARAGNLALRAGGPDTPIWALEGPELSFKRGDTAEIAFGNDLPLPSLLNWRGIDGVPAIEPLTARAPLASGGKEALQVPLRHAGTFLCDLGLLGDGQARPSRSRALVVRESETVTVDRDEVLLIEDWRVLPDGKAIAPGGDPKDAMPIYSINGRTSLDISAKTNEPRQDSLYKWLPTICYCSQIGELRCSGYGHRRPTRRAVPGPQRRAGDRAGRPGRCLRRCDGAGGHDLLRSSSTTARMPVRSEN